MEANPPPPPPCNTNYSCCLSNQKISKPQMKKITRSTSHVAITSNTEQHTIRTMNFAYNEHLTRITILCTKISNCSYRTSYFFCIFFLVVSGTRCIYAVTYFFSLVPMAGCYLSWGNDKNETVPLWCRRGLLAYVYNGVSC